jgi:hypothetical protein
VESQVAEEAVLETYKAVRKKFYEAADAVFGPGFFSMTEYYYIKKTGLNPFAMLFSEPRVVYDEWIRMFKGEEPVRMLIENVAGPRYSTLLAHIQRNDGIKVWDFFNKMAQGLSVAA